MHGIKIMKNKLTKKDHKMTMKKHKKPISKLTWEQEQPQEMHDYQKRPRDNRETEEHYACVGLMVAHE